MVYGALYSTDVSEDMPLSYTELKRTLINLRFAAI
jgi:hypothetical protein